MAFVVRRRLTGSLWGVTFVAMALARQPRATLFLSAVLGVAAIALTTPVLMSWGRRVRSGVRVVAHGPQHEESAGLSVAAATCVRTLDEPNRTTAEDVLDLVRMDDDGGRQVARPSISGRQVP